MASSAPWAAEDLRRNARSWTLEGDAKLLEFMQTISENLEKRAQNTNAKMNDMALNLQETSVSLENVTNKLSALQHSQFVENRVYEDDETIANISEVPVDIQNGKKKYDPIETLNKVLKNSISMMDKCYQKVSIDVEDSDDEEGLSKSIVYKPKNFFEQRPLPHIIGSKEWKEKWHIGLCDTDEDYSDEENQEEYSDTSENASLSASLPSNAPTISESESSVWGLHHKSNLKRPTIYSSDEEASSNTATSKTSSDEIQRLGNNKPFIPPAQVLPPQDQKYYIHNPKQKGLFDESSEESDHDISNSKSQPQIVKQLSNKQKGANMISNIFSDEPPDMDEVDRRDDNEKENTQLFCDSDGESSVPNKNQNSNKNIEDKFTNIRKKPVNLFDDDDFDSFMKELDKKANEKLSQITKKKDAANLFADVNDEEQEQVISSPLPTVEKDEVKNNLENKTETKKPLFDSESEDNIFQSITNKSKSFETTAKTRLRNLFDDESSDDDFESIFKTNSKVGSTNSIEKVNEVKVNNTENATVNSNLDEADSESSTSNNVMRNNSNLSESKNVPPIFFGKPPQDDDLFTNMRKEAESISSITSSSILRDKIHDKDVSSVKPKISDLFSDDLLDDDDIFASSKLPPVPAPRAKVDANLEDDLSGSDVKSRNAKLFPAQDPVLTTSSASNSNTLAHQIDSVKGNINFSNINEDFNKPPEVIGTLKTASKDIFKNSGKEEKMSANTLSNNFYEDEPPDDDDIFSSSRKEYKTARKEYKTEVNDTINTKLKEEDTVCVSPSSTEISSDHSIVAEKLQDSPNAHINSEKIHEKSGSTPTSSKFKLPSLFDDEPPDEEDFIFSNSSITNKSVSCSENLPSSESEKDELREQNKLESSIAPEQPVSSSPDLSEDTIKDQSQNVFTKSSADEEIPSTFEDFTNISQHTVNEDSSKKTKDSVTTSKFQLISAESKERSENGPHTSSTTDFKVPDEEDNQFLNNEDDTVKDTEKLADNSNTSASIYSTINLFQDIPPEDDFQSPGDIKRLHNIFYDDFAETIPTTSTFPRKKSTNYFFSDEPPPDSFDDDTIGEIEKEYGKTVTSFQESDTESIEPTVGNKEKDLIPEQSEPDNKTFSVAELIKKSETDRTHSKPQTNISAPKKLNTNLNINVAALIPGAKRPNIKTQSSIEKDKSQSSMSVDVNEEPENYIAPPKDTTNSASVSSQSSSESNRLLNLNKTRAKIHAKRRPSTRKGRQESYRKSLISDIVDGSDDDTISGNDGKSEEEVSLPTEPTNDKSQLFSTQLSQNNSQRREVNASVGQSVISEHAEDGDWFKKSVDTKKANKTDNTIVENSVKSDNVTTAAGESDDDLFASTVTKPLTKVTTIFKEEKPKEVLKNETQTTQSIFQDDSDDDLFNNRQKSKNSIISSKPKGDIQTKIFSSDEDDDDIFSKSFKPNKQLDGRSEKNVPKKLTVPNSKNLFGDDDDDEDDDLFGSSVTKNNASTRVVKVPKKPEKRSPAGSITGDNPLADLLSG